MSISWYIVAKCIVCYVSHLLHCKCLEWNLCLQGNTDILLTLGKVDEKSEIAKSNMYLFIWHRAFFYVPYLLCILCNCSVTAEFATPRGA